MNYVACTATNPSDQYADMIYIDFDIYSYNNNYIHIKNLF